MSPTNIKSCYHIRQLRQIRSSLDTNSAIILANALVSSKLDYCNSLYYKLPACSLNRLLQVVQNALARVVVPSVKLAPIIFLRLSVVSRLHWLPIKHRIDCKIASRTFKTLHFDQSSYLAELLIPETSTRPRPFCLSTQTSVYLPLNLNLVNVLSLLLHLLSGTLFPLTFALVLQSLPFILFFRLISFLLRSFLTWTDFLANSLHVFDLSLVACLDLIMWVTGFC